MAWFTAVYRLESTPADIEARAQALAVEQSIEMPPSAVRQPEILQNILAKVPKHAIAQLKPQVQDVLHAETYEEGLKQGAELIARYKNVYPSAMTCLEKDLHECVVYLQFPREHWRSIRTANAIERLFGENRRRMKVVPGFPTEMSGLKLIYATLISASSRWHGLRVSPAAAEQLAKIRTEQDQKRKELINRIKAEEFEYDLVPASR